MNLERTQCQRVRPSSGKSRRPELERRGRCVADLCAREIGRGPRICCGPAEAPSAPRQSELATPILRNYNQRSN